MQIFLMLPDSSFVDMNDREFMYRVCAVSLCCPLQSGGIGIQILYSDFENNLYDEDEGDDSTTVVTPLKTIVKGQRQYL